MKLHSVEFFVKKEKNIYYDSYKSMEKKNAFWQPIYLRLDIIHLF